MKFDLKITVGPSEIAMGVRKNCEACPIALAVQKAIFEQQRMQGYMVFVKSGCIQIVKDEHVYAQSGIPLDAQIFMEEFDEDGTEAVAPFSVELSFETPN